MSKAQHTLLPWALSYGYALPSIGRSATYVAPAHADHVGIKLATPWIEGAWDDDEEAAANAEFIVRACNSHYDLVEALQNISARANPDEMRLIAQRALAKARGEA